MKSRNAENTPNVPVQSDVTEEKGRRAPTPEELIQGAFDIHVDRGEIHGCVSRDRPSTPDDVANAVVFLASDESSDITGMELSMDGGTAHLKSLSNDVRYGSPVTPNEIANGMFRGHRFRSTAGGRVEHVGTFDGRTKNHRCNCGVVRRYFNDFIQHDCGLGGGRRAGSDC